MQRFFAGCFLGSSIATVLVLTVANPLVAPAVETRPEFRTLAKQKLEADRQAQDSERRLLVALLELDQLRRAGGRDIVKPGGVEVAPEDLIPAPKEPFPLPFPLPLPTKPETFPVPEPVPEPEEEGEEEHMAAATTTKSTALAKSPGATLALSSVDELYRLSDILYRGGASNLPNVGSPNHVFHLILHGLEIGLTPTQALANLAMGKNGKPSIMGDGALALVMQSGLLEDIKEFWEGEGESRKGVCIVKRKGFAEPRRFEFTTAQAEQAGLIKRAKNEKGDGPWIAYRDRMLRYRPLGYALRDVFPDVLKGLYLTEELSEPQQPDLSVVNTEVKVVGATADAPASATPTSTAPTEPEPQQQQLASGAHNMQPVTAAQLEEIKQLKALAMAAKGISDPLAIKSEWEQILTAYQVPSALKLTEAQAARLIAELGAKHDPFTSPTSTTT